MAAVLLRVAGLVLALMAVLFNTYLLSLFDPSPPLGTVTARGIRSAQATYLVSGLLLLLLAEAVSPSATHRLLKGFFNKRLSLNLLLTVLSVAVPILVLELALRPFTIHHQAKKPTTLFVRDRDLGWKLRPGARANWGGVEVEVNRKGLRGPEIPYERKGRALRILYLGDSVTFGYKLPHYSMSFPYVVESLLEQQKQLEVETINAGVGGYSPWQCDVYLRSEGLKYQPDVVLLGFVLNDVTEKFMLTRFGGTGIGTQLSMSNYSAHPWLADNVAIYAAIARITTRLQFGPDPRSGALARQLLSAHDLAREPESRRVKNAWDVTLRNLGRLVEYCQENDLRLFIVMFPFTFQFQDPSALDAPQRVLGSFCHDRKVACLDLLPLLSRRIQEQNLEPSDLFLDQDHLSYAGSKEVAGFIVEFLEQEISLDGQ